MKLRDKIKARTFGHCAYCGIKLPKRWHIDHFWPKNRKHQLDSSIKKQYGIPEWLTDVEDERNKLASCPRCNGWKHSLSLEGFRRAIERLIKTQYKRNSQYRMMVDMGMVEVVSESVYFYFEFLEIDMFDENALYPPDYEDHLQEVTAQNTQNQHP